MSDEHENDDQNEQQHQQYEKASAERWVQTEAELLEAFGASTRSMHHAARMAASRSPEDLDAHIELRRSFLKAFDELMVPRGERPIDRLLKMLEGSLPLIIDTLAKGSGPIVEAQRQPTPVDPMSEYVDEQREVGESIARFVQLMNGMSSAQCRIIVKSFEQYLSERERIDQAAEHVAEQARADASAAAETP